MLKGVLPLKMEKKKLDCNLQSCEEIKISVVTKTKNKQQKLITNQTNEQTRKPLYGNLF